METLGDAEQKDCPEWESWFHQGPRLPMSSPFAKRSLREPLRGKTFACHCLDAGLPTVASERSERFGEGWYRYGDSNPGPVAENHVS